MEEVIICKCGKSNNWVIGEDNVYCGSCGYELKHGLVRADVWKANRVIEMETGRLGDNW